MENAHQESCPCKRMKCPRHGDCAACREHHHASARKPLTRCEKLARKQRRKAERREGKARIRADVVGVIALESPCMYDIKGVQDGEYMMDDSDYTVPILSVYSDASYPYLREWKQYRNNVKFLESKNGNYENIYYQGIGHMGLCDLSLASPILASIPDQRKSEVELREQLTKLNSDCLEFLQRVV